MGAAVIIDFRWRVCPGRLTGAIEALQGGRVQVITVTVAQARRWPVAV